MRTPLTMEEMGSDRSESVLMENTWLREIGREILGENNTELNK
jgi:hypothetical protein